jgi:hypothetical protein
MIYQTQYLTVLILNGIVLIVKPCAIRKIHGKMADFWSSKYTKEKPNPIDFGNNPI